MDIVILSGKGGTGKTTVSTNLAAVVPGGIALLDCDVEEPNGHLYLKEDLERTISVRTSFPIIDEEKCIHCGKCAQFCSFNALLSTKRMNIVMAELCHDCGGCALVCPQQVISYGEREVGRVGKITCREDLLFVDGILNTGEFSAEKVIGAVLGEAHERTHRIIDAPPGCACSAVKAAEGADFALLVTEPTPFALSDMKMVVEMLEKLSVPAGVFINKSGENREPLLAYCMSKNLPVLGELNFSKDYGTTIVKGELLVDHHNEVKELFEDLWKSVKVREK